MIYIQLFFSFFQIGLLSFGGGMASMPIIQSQVVEHYGWISLTEFTDLITIAQMTPGPIAVNSATFVGIRIAGIPGALIATFGCILPSCIIVFTLAWLYSKYSDMAIIKSILKGLRPAIVALIASAGITILNLAVYGEGKEITLTINQLIPFTIFVAAVVVLRKWKLSPIGVMMGCGVLGGIVYLLI